MQKMHCKIRKLTGAHDNKEEHQQEEKSTITPKTKPMIKKVE